MALVPPATVEPHELSWEVLEAMLEGCQVIGFDWRYLYLNPATARQARVQREQLLGRTMMDCFPGIERSPMFALLERVMRERSPATMENDFEYPDGARAYFELRFVPVPSGVCILSLDITERRHQLAAIVNDSDDAIVGRRLGGIVTSWNRSAERIFGYTAQEMVGRPISPLFPPERAAEEAALEARIVRGERIEHFESIRRAKDGAAVEVSTTLSPIRDRDGAIVGVSSIARDIRGVKRLERELVAARERAEAMNHELEAFSYSVAHDLRAPLRAIDGFGQALLEDCGPMLDEAGHAHLRQVRDSAQRMGQLIDDLLTLSRVSRRELARVEVDVSQISRAVLARLSAAEPARRVEARVAEGLRATADPGLTAILLENLLANAWKFSRRRAVAHIEVGRDEVGFFVRDDGAGFDPRYGHKLFGAFQRLHAASEFEGTGIGLAIVGRIVRRHGGAVKAEGAVGSGAVFRFTLEGEPSPQGNGET